MDKIINWKDWFTNTKKYTVYHEQELEIAGILRECRFNTVFDVGCGNKRFNSVFYEMEYVGLDLTTGWDVLGEWGDKKYDLVFCSLILLLFNDEDAKKILKKMIEHSNKYVFICEENVESEGKFTHDYEKLVGPASTKGTMKCNPKWDWFLWTV